MARAAHHATVAHRDPGRGVVRAPIPTPHAVWKLSTAGPFTNTLTRCCRRTCRPFEKAYGRYKRAWDVPDGIDFQSFRRRVISLLEEVELRHRSATSETPKLPAPTPATCCEVGCQRREQPRLTGPPPAHQPAAAPVLSVERLSFREMLPLPESSPPVPSRPISPFAPTSSVKAISSSA
jgi:hypothetical protein